MYSFKSLNKKLLCFSLAVSLNLISANLSQAETQNENIEVYTNQVIRQIPDDYTGFSMEKDNINYGLYNQDNKVLVKLHQNLGKGVLRFGADSTNFAVLESQKNKWPKSCNLKSVIKDSEVENMFKFAEKINWKVIYGINFNCVSPDGAAEELKKVKSINPDLVSFEFGNEPDVFIIKNIRPEGWLPKDYIHDSDMLIEKSLDVNPDAKISGPGIGSYIENEKWFKPFIDSKSSQKLSFFSVHFYPMVRMDGLDTKAIYYPSIPHMLSSGYQDFIIKTFKELVDESKNLNKQLRVTEMNSAARSGKDNVSNVFASALWFTDYAFKLLETGISGVNIQQDLLVLNDLYSPMHIKQNNYVINPIYYGMLFFANASGENLLKTSKTLNNKLAVFATKDTKHLKVTLINKDDKNDSEVNLKIDGNKYKSARLLKLTAPTLEAKENITFGNSIVDKNGNWNPNNEENITVNNNSIHIKVEHGSASLLILEPDNSK